MAQSRPAARVDQEGWERERSGVQRNFEWLAQRLIDTGGKSIVLRWGQGTVTWPGGSKTSNTTTAVHGLGRTPVAVVATCNNQVGAGLCAVDARFDGTNVYLQLETAAGFAPANTVTNPVSWVAIG